MIIWHAVTTALHVSLMDTRQLHRPKPVLPREDGSCACQLKEVTALLRVGFWIILPGSFHSRTSKVRQIAPSSPVCVPLLAFPGSFRIFDTRFSMERSPILILILRVAFIKQYEFIVYNDYRIVCTLPCTLVMMRAVSAWR